MLLTDQNKFENNTVIQLKGMEKNLGPHNFIALASKNTDKEVYRI